MRFACKFQVVDFKSQNSTVNIRSNPLYLWHLADDITQFIVWQQNCWIEIKYNAFGSWILTKPRSSDAQHQLPTTALFIDGIPVFPVTSVRNLGIFVDASLVMRTHVQRTVSECFAALRQLRQIRNSVPTASFKSLVVALVITRLDLGNDVLIGLPTNLLRRLQSVQNAAARLIFKRRRFDHRCTGHLALAGHPGARRLQDRCIDVQSSTWDRTELSRTCCSCRRSTCMVDGLSALLALTAWWCHRSSSQQSVVGLSWLPVLKFGTFYRKMLHRHRRCQPSAKDWRLSFLHLVL